MSTPDRIYLDQSTKQNDVRGRDTEFTVSDFKWDRTRVEYIRSDIVEAQLAAAMSWIPVADAGWKEDETVDVRVKDGRRLVNVYFSGNDDIRDTDQKNHWKGSIDDVTHILRIKPPGEQQ